MIDNTDRGLIKWSLLWEELFEIHRALAQRPRTPMVESLMAELNAAGYTLEVDLKEQPMNNNEPTFPLTASDPMALAALRYYNQLRAVAGLQGFTDDVAAFEKFAKEHVTP